MTTNKIHATDSEKPKRRGLKHNLKENHKPQKRKEAEKERKKEEIQKQPEKMFKMAINVYLWKITLNINGLNTLIKRLTMADWIIKQQPTTCCLPETHFTMRDTQITSQEIFHTNRNDRNMMVAMLIWDNIDFKIKAIKKDVAGHCVVCLAAQSCLILRDPIDCSPPGSSVHGDLSGKNTGVGCHALL